MNNRTVIGGVSYETVGSSSSNLLLRCNGTARIQWGNKLIDLIKNGKITSSEEQELVFITDDEQKARKDGLYVLNTEDGTKQKIFVIKGGKKYDFNEIDLYISAKNKQDITVDQKKQVLENIGLYYNTLADVENSKIQNGIVYVLDKHALYSVNNGTIQEYTIAVEKQRNLENGINTSQTHTQLFSKGMIIMHYGAQDIPEGWVICNGKMYTNEGVTYKAPDLSDLFKYEQDGNSLIYIMKL